MRYGRMSYQMITIRPINKDYYDGFIVEGHADYAPHGQDIVCAGVTGALFTAYHALEYHAQESNGLEAVLSSGYANIRISPGTVFTDSIVDAFLDTLTAIQETYPGTISIEGDYNHEQRV